MSGPDVWGPHGWKFIHYITLGYPNQPSIEIKERYLNFFNSLKYVIPCSICGVNFIKHMEEYPLTDKILSNKTDFINWGILMHNLVNISNNKPQYSNAEGLAAIKKNSIGDCPGKIINYEIFPVEKFSNKKPNWFSDNLLVILIIVIFILILYIVINRCYIKTKI